MNDAQQLTAAVPDKIARVFTHLRGLSNLHGDLLYGLYGHLGHLLRVEHGVDGVGLDGVHHLADNLLLGLHDGGLYGGGGGLDLGLLQNAIVYFDVDAEILTHTRGQIRF